MTEPINIRHLAGLSEDAARQRLREEGYNELPSSKGRSVLAIAFEVVREPMFLMLVACGGIYLLMGPEHFRDAMMLLGFVLVVMGITIYQERRTERALEALKDLSSPRALVIRGGHRTRIPGREVVRGDVIVLAEGDRVPADGVLMYAVNLSVDESLLTGESVPVRKRASGDLSEMIRPGGEDLPCVFSGTLVTAGHGVAEVRSTGMRTELGKIGKALQTVEPEETLLQRETGRLVRNLAVVGLALCGLVVVLYGVTRGNTSKAWEEGLLTGITMAMATLPEEFPVVLTIFLALGAWRLSQNRVLTRRMPAVETLGASTVLCVDKTGTLTLNQMSVRQIVAGGSPFDTGDTALKVLPDKFHETLEYGILASKRDPFDPMEKALTDVGAKYLARTEHLHKNWRLIHEYPLCPELLAISRVWQSPEGHDFVIATKGAPETIGDLCHLPRSQREELEGRVAHMAGEGLRVLGVARARFKRGELPQGQHGFAFEFVGLVGLADPVRPSVPASVEECHAAGVRVIMITGDYAVTAQTIARQIGLRNPDQTLTGPELETMSDGKLAERIRTVNIFARVVPEQKLRIVNALKANGEIVAMTGDGVNDAPALKSAHIGIAMGGRGTDVARESSALVLLDDDFSSIVQAVKLGRRIFDNIKKAIAYVFAVHVPIAGLSLAPVLLFHWPIILMPVHVVFLELIIDPACSIIFESEAAEPDVMRRPPRSPGERLFGLRMIWLSILQGVSVLAIVVGVFAVARHSGHSEDSARGLTFVTLVVANLCLILTNRSWSRGMLTVLKEPNAAVKWITGAVFAGLGLVLFVPFFQRLFHFGALHGPDLLICVIAGVISIAWFEAAKVYCSRLLLPSAGGEHQHM